MRGSDPGSAREEAERLVATALAAVRLAAAGRGSAGPFAGLGDAIFGAFGAGSGPHDHGGAQDGAFATGAAECRACPLCRMIAALRDPSPEFAERLATGAGDFAAGVASLLRAFGEAAGHSGGAPDPAPAGADRRSAQPAPPDEVWRSATRAGDDQWSAPAPMQRDGSSPTAEPDVWSAATRADDDNGERRGGSAGSGGGPATARPAGAKPMARKAVKRAAGAAAHEGASRSSSARPRPKKAAPRRVDGDPGGAGGVASRGDAGPGDEA